jgi:excisionase family DNA binding protein
MSYNLVTAAAAIGVNKSTVLRAIKAGRISAQRDDTGWRIEPAELHRVFPPLPSPATMPPAAERRDAMADTLVSELRAVISDLRADRDHWRAAFETAQRLLPAPSQQQATDPEPPNNALARVWHWMRATSER